MIYLIRAITRPALVWSGESRLGGALGAGAAARVAAAVAAVVVVVVVAVAKGALDG